MIQEPTKDLLQLIALLAWVTPSDAKQYLKKIEENLDNQKQVEREKERWKNHKMYKENTKAQLESMCKKMRIPVVASTLKHQLVSLIVAKKGDEPPPPVNSTSCFYSGHLSSVPSTITGIRRLTIPYLRTILTHHHLPVIGCKEQLVLRVYLLGQGRKVAVTAKEEEQLKDLIDIASKVIMEQRKLNISSHIYRKRKYLLQSSAKFVPVPTHIVDADNLCELFDPLLTSIENIRKKRLEDDTRCPLPTSSVTSGSSDEEDVERMKTVGAKIHIKWDKEEVVGTGWRGGWYTALVNSYCEGTDELTVTYSSERTTPYTEELSDLVSRQKID